MGAEQKSRRAEDVADGAEGGDLENMFTTECSLTAAYEGITSGKKYEIVFRPRYHPENSQ